MLIALWLTTDQWINLGIMAATFLGGGGLLGIGAWMVAIFRNTRSMARSLAHLPSTTEAVAKHSTEIKTHDDTLIKHEGIWTEHGRRIGALETWRKETDGKISMTVTPAEAKETIQGP